jgi:4-amino-4-deoxy-L-arabinose transferase-like glycosyltransferase
MRIANRNNAAKRWYMDFFCLFLVIGLNPITWFLNHSSRQFPPDALAYLTMGRDLFHNGKLYLSGWSYADSGLILPPLYPFFIACGQLLIGDSPDVAEWVSCILTLITSVAIYLYIKEMINRVFAVLTVLLIQINYYYFSIGMLPLSESTLLLATSCMLLLTLKFFKDQGSVGKKLPFVLGMSCGLVVLSRQIGLMALIFLGIIGLMKILVSHGEEHGRIILKNLLFIILGWLVLLVPYTAIIYHQTGHHPFQQNFREKEIKITAVDSETLSEMKQIEGLPEENYAMIYAKRRLMRKLLPDSSQMFCRIDGEKREENWLLSRFIAVVKKPEAYIDRIISNILLLREPLGSSVLYLFLVSCISPFLIRAEKKELLDRLLLPCFIIFYLFAVSGFTDTVSRYVYVVFPFAFMQIAGELFVFWRAISGTIGNRIWGAALVCAAYAFFAFATPRYFNSLGLSSKVGSVDAEFRKMRDTVKGEPVFSLFPYSSYLAGGIYRVLPNDTLEKVAAHGKLTGVRWLLVAWTGHTRSELHFYNRARWYSSPSLEEHYSHLVELRCSTPDGWARLYEFR